MECREKVRKISELEGRENEISLEGKGEKRERDMDG